MKEGFYLYQNYHYDEIILYEYRNGILSFYNNKVSHGKKTYQMKDYGWFLSVRNPIDMDLEFLEDL